MNNFDKPFYTVAEAAELLRVNEKTIYRIIKARKIAYYKVGVQIRISAAELERLKVPAENQEN